jgi:ethanolamine utilization protein EutN
MGDKLLWVTGSGATVVAVDRLGAGPGDRVLVAHGSRVRDLTLGEAVPVKDVIVAIVDGVELK